MIKDLIARSLTDFRVGFSNMHGEKLFNKGHRERLDSKSWQKLDGKAWQQVIGKAWQQSLVKDQTAKSWEKFGWRH